VLDVLIIGAGHNGLTAACYLARAGLDVLVLEARDIIGGMTTTEAPIPNAPNHRLNLSGIHYVHFNVSTVPKDLELHRFGFDLREIDPPHAILDPDGGSIAMWRDPKRTADEMRRFSTHDADAYLDLLRTLDAGLDMAAPMLASSVVPPTPASLAAGAVGVAKGVRHIPDLMGILTSTVAEVVSERFRHPLVQGLLAAQVQGLTQPGSGATCTLYPWMHRFGSGRPVGGTGAIADALARCLTAAKGRVRTSAIVEELLVAGDRVTGVRLDTGEELTARAVIASCDPLQTLTRLLPSGTLPERLEHRAAQIPTKFSGGTQLKIDMAMEGRIDLTRHNAWRGDDLDLRIPVTYQGTFEQLLDAAEKAMTGDLAEFTPYAATVPTAFDPSQAPAGQDTVWIWVQPLPYQSRLPVEEFEAGIQTGVLKDLSQYYDGIAELEIGRVVESWRGLEARTRAPYGNWAHVDFQLFRNGPLRPARGFAGHRTPVDGLFLSGAGTHPGPGISGLPGQLAASAS